MHACLSLCASIEAIFLLTAPIAALAEFLLSSRRTPVPDSTYQHDMQVIMHDRALAPLAETALLIPSSGVPVPVHRLYIPPVLLCRVLTAA